MVVSDDDAHSALIQAVCFAKPPRQSEVWSVVATVNMSAKTTANLFCLLAQETGRLKDIPNSLPDPIRVNAIFVFFLATLTGIVDLNAEERPPAASPLVNTILTSPQVVTARWGAHMSEADKILLVARRLQGVDEENRPECLDAIIKSTAGWDPEDFDGFSLVVAKTDVVAESKLN
jgi:hypothetical protein